MARGAGGEPGVRVGGGGIARVGDEVVQPEVQPEVPLGETSIL